MSENKEPVCHHEPLFTVTNSHFESCGVPKLVEDSDLKVYRGYFRNQHGEQWLYEHKYGERSGTIRGGDVNWNNVHKVHLAAPNPLQSPGSPLVLGRYSLYTGWVLGPAESMWLAACWIAATHTNLRDYLNNEMDAWVQTVVPAPDAS
jgi:hypothetical protein